VPLSTLLVLIVQLKKNSLNGQRCMITMILSVRISGLKVMIKTLLMHAKHTMNQIVHLTLLLVGWFGQIKFAGIINSG
jgi:hypothetical protein